MFWSDTSSSSGKVASGLCFFPAVVAFLSLRGVHLGTFEEEVIMWLMYVVARNGGKGGFGFVVGMEKILTML